MQRASVMNSHCYSASVYIIHVGKFHPNCTTPFLLTPRVPILVLFDFPSNQMAEAISELDDLLEQLDSKRSSVASGDDSRRATTLDSKWEGELDGLLEDLKIKKPDSQTKQTSTPPSKQATTAAPKSSFAPSPPASEPKLTVPSNKQQ